MKLIKSRKIIILCIICSIVLNATPLWVKEAKAIGDGFGYVFSRFLDQYGNEIASSLTTPVDLKGNYIIKTTLIAKAIEGYTIDTVTLSNGTQLSDPYEVYVSEANTIDNKLEVIFRYKPVYNQSNIHVLYRGTQPDGTISDSFEEWGEVVIGKPYTITVRKEPNPGWTFQNIMIDGIVVSANPQNYTFNTSKINHEIIVNYKVSAYSPGDINIHATDVELDKSGNVVIQPGGADYFGRRAETIYSSTGTLNKIISSPTGGSGKSDLKVGFAVVSKTNGNPTEGMNNYYDRKERATTMTYDFNTGKSAWYVHFYWIPKDSDPNPPAGGDITFNPNETDWTNRGKLGEGYGSYPIDVKFIGSNPTMAQGSVNYYHYQPVPPTVGPDGKPITHPPIITNHTYPFPVEYTLQGITVSGDANGYISGASGNINITKEGEKLSLAASGTWNTPKYSVPAGDGYDSQTGLVIPPAPPNPTGKSSYYNIDWTKANINLPRASNRWINNPVVYPVNINVTDNLSGFSSGNSVVVSDYSHYNNNATDSLPYASKSYNKTVELDDGMYRIDVTANDRAGNQSSDSSEKYLIDGTDPVVNFNVKPKIFNEENGAVRKQSVKGENFAYFGKLTASDNLSGVAKIQYKWTYWNNKPANGYEVIYTSPYTYSDRYKEIIEKEIEKPVGDNLYLHIELWDTAGNYTYKSFGPYEDPIKLKDFQVTDIRDPRWRSVFWNDSEYKDYKGRTFKVNELPIDDRSHPTLENAYPKKGYAFFFDVTSEFLYRENDRIEIKPNFYYLKGNERIRVDCYYNNDNNPLVKFGSEKDNSTLNLNTKRYGDVLIGNHSKLVLTRGVRITKGREWENYDGIKGWKDEIQYKDGKEQWWYGKYFIPSSSVFVKSGDIPRPENILKGGNILINFEIVAYKNGVETFSTDQIFSYNLKQWQLEGGPKNSDYRIGDVIVFNAKYSALSDYTVRVIQ